MVVYQKENGKWYLNLMIRGKRYHRGIPEATTKRDAEKAEAILKAELLQGRYKLAESKGEMLFSKLVEEYNKYAMTNNLSWKKDISRVNKILAFFGNKKLREITPMLIEKYRFQRKQTPKRNGKPLTNSSINRETAILRKMFNIAIDNGWTDDNPCCSKKVKPLREDNKKERYLLPDEEELLLSYCVDNYSYMKPILICALHTGMRRSEILNLNWDCVDLKKGYITVTKTKSGKDRTIPISKELLVCFKKLYACKNAEYVFVNPETKKPYYGIRKSYEYLFKKAGIKNMRFHDLRHTAATRMVAAGVDLIVVQEILGHACITTTMRYSHPVPERKKFAIEALANFGKINKETNVLSLKINN